MNNRRLPVSIITLKLVRPRLEVYYPMVIGSKNLAVQNKVNDAIQNLVQQLIREQGYYENSMTQITGYYEIKTNERGILSLALINDAYSGGAHGLTVIKSITADLETGKIYNLQDLFKPDSNYVERISDIVEKKIKDRNIYLLGDFKGIRPDQDFYIADKALVIYFQLYELTSYAFGFPYFPISVYDIKEIISEDSPFDRLIY
ncbi:MAG: hypothetical protein PWQ37_1130 [Candidatus Petromonas sp.]|nr:hypothetical protein [Candidatus Petromonas sp.]